MHAQQSSERTLFLQSASAMIGFLLLLALAGMPLNSLKASSAPLQGQQSSLQK